VRPRPGPRWRPGEGNAAGGGAHGEDQDELAVAEGRHCRACGLVGVAARPDRGQAGAGQDVEGLDQPAAAEVADVVVRQDTGVRPHPPQRGQVGRVHPEVHLLARAKSSLVVTLVSGLIRTSGAAAARTPKASPHGHAWSTGRGTGPCTRSARRM
jgi:hypothetical protein